MSKRIYDVDVMIQRAITAKPQTLASLVPYTGMSRETIRMALLRLKERGEIVGESGTYRPAQVAA